MVDRSIVKAVFLDHSYCVPVSLGEEIKKIKSNYIMDERGETLSWEEAMGIQFDPPTSDTALACSALSPSHSVDSGCDNDLNLFGELGQYCIDDIDALFNMSDSGDGSKELPQKIPPESTGRCSNTSTHSSTTSLPNTSGTSRKRATKDSMDEYDKNRKNAIAARENRQKKKKYIESIENENKALKRENEILRKKESNHAKTVEKLENQVAYLKNVISNHSALTPLLKSLVSTPGVTFMSSLTGKEPQQKSTPGLGDCDDDDDNDRIYKTRSKKRNLDDASSISGSSKKCKEVRGGICLHVDQNKVSLELCDQCSIKAQGNGHA